MSDDASDQPASEDASASGDSPRPEESGETADGAVSGLPAAVVEEAETLTRRARDTVDDNEGAAYRHERAELLAQHGYTARVREDDTRDVLVLYPDEWVEDGVVRTDRIEDIDRGFERALSGPGEADDWAAVDDRNRAIASAVREEHGPVHGANVDALADFMGNHYAKPIPDATREELEEFLTEYFPRNAFPSDEQRDVVEKSVRVAFDAAGQSCPLTPG